MRTLGDMAWINQYIGIPYEPGGRSKDGVDCYGLVKLVYCDQYGELLPDWATQDMSLKVMGKEISGVVDGGDFEYRDAPMDGDFVICYRTRSAHHIGLYYAGSVLHCIDGIGAVFEPLSRFKRNYTKVVYGEWNPCL